jgi:hypothetical protein
MQHMPSDSDFERTRQLVPTPIVQQSVEGLRELRASVVDREHYDP